MSPEPRPSPLVPGPSFPPPPPLFAVIEPPRDRRPPQDIINEFWKDFSIEKPSKGALLLQMLANWPWELCAFLEALAAEQLGPGTRRRCLS